MWFHSDSCYVQLFLRSSGGRPRCLSSSLVESIPDCGCGGGHLLDCQDWPGWDHPSPVAPSSSLNRQRLRPWILQITQQMNIIKLSIITSSFNALPSFHNHEHIFFSQATGTEKQQKLKQWIYIYVKYQLGRCCSNECITPIVHYRNSSRQSVFTSCNLPTTGNICTLYKG